MGVWRCVCLLAGSVLLTGCLGGSSGGGGGGSGGPSSQELADAIHEVDIAGAQGLAVTGPSGEASTASQPTKADSDTLEAHSLYKVTADGRLERVAITDEAGEEAPRGTIRPVGVFDLSQNFAGLVFWVPGYASDEGHQLFVNQADFRTYLVDKASNRAYDASDILPAHIIDPAGDGEEGNADNPPTPIVSMRLMAVREAADGMLYVSAPTVEALDSQAHDTSRETLLTRTDVTDLGDEALQAVELPTGPEAAGRFEVHRDGDFLEYTSGDHVDGWLRRIVNLTDEGDTLMVVNQIPGETWDDGTTPVEPETWTVRDRDGGLHVVARTSADYGDRDPMFRLYELESITNGQLNYGEPVEMPVVDAATGEVIHAGGVFWRHMNTTGLIPYEGHPITRHEVGGRLLYVDFPVQQNTLSIAEVNFQDERMVDHTDLVTGPLGGDVPSQLEVSEHYIWLLGSSDGTSTDDTIIRHDPAAQRIDVVEVDSTLELQRFEVMGADTVMFEAFRTSDASYVRGRISAASGEVEVTDVISEFEPRIFALNPVRPADFIVIDGDPQEWPLDTRVFNGEAGTGPVGDDLLHYSEQTGNGRYYGLVEFDGAIDPDNWTVVNLAGTYHVEMNADEAWLVINDGSDELEFVEIGARHALGETVEFFVPLEAIEPIADAPGANSVKRFDVDMQDELDSLP